MNRLLERLKLATNQKMTLSGRGRHSSNLNLGYFFMRHFGHCPVIVLKLAVTVFTGLSFRTL